MASSSCSGSKDKKPWLKSRSHRQFQQPQRRARRLVHTQRPVILSAKGIVGNLSGRSRALGSLLHTQRPVILSAAQGSRATERKSKDPENVSLAMLIQGVL